MFGMLWALCIDKEQTEKDSLEQDEISLQKTYAVHLAGDIRRPL